MQKIPIKLLQRVDECYFVNWKAFEALNKIKFLNFRALNECLLGLNSRCSSVILEIFSLSINIMLVLLLYRNMLTFYSSHPRQCWAFKYNIHAWVYKVHGRNKLEGGKPFLLCTLYVRERPGEGGTLTRSVTRNVTRLLWGKGVTAFSPIRRGRIPSLWRI